MIKFWKNVLLYNKLDELMKLKLLFGAIFESNQQISNENVWYIVVCKKLIVVLHNLSDGEEVLPPFQKKYPVDFDDELKIGDVRYDDMT